MFIPELPESLVLKSEKQGLAPARSVQAMTSPGHIHAAAHLYGVETVAPAGARVLELGCGEGTNLLPFLLAHPEASAVGIDLFPEAIEAGNEQARALGLANLDLYCVDLETLLASSPGEFDYIVIHGLFTLLDDPAREALLRFCRQHLTGRGVVCLAWNVLPGASASKTLQDAIALHSAQAQDDAGRLQSARAMLTYMSLGLAPDNAQRKALASAVRQAESQADELFTLQYLQGFNAAGYLVDFQALVRQAGFAVAGDLAPHTECPAHYGDNVSQLQQAICPQPSKILAQQYLDFAVNRSQRFSLLVAEEREQEVKNEPDFNRLRDFSWAGNYQRSVGENGRINNSLVAASGRTFTTDDLLTLTILDVVGEAWPLSVSFEQLVFHTSSPDNPSDDHAERVLNALRALFIQGEAELHFCLGRGVYNGARHAEISAFSHGISALRAGFNLWHEPVALSACELEVLSDLSPETDPDALEGLRRKGMLLASPERWKKHFQRRAGQDSEAVFVASLLPLILYASDPQSGGFSTAGHGPAAGSARSVKPVPARYMDEINASIQQGEYDRARTKARAMCEQFADNPNAWLELARVHSRTSNHKEALRACAAALKLAASSWTLYYEIAMILWHLDYGWHTGRLIRAILRCDKKNALVWDSLARMYRDFNDLVSAERCAREAVKLQPTNAGINSGLGTILGDRSQMEEAFGWLRKALRYSNYDVNYHTNLLFGLTHSAEISPQALFEEHLDYGRRLEKWAKAQRLALPHGDDRNPHRTLRIGFVSGDLCRHPVANFVRPFWNMLATPDFERFVYSTSPMYDEVSAGFAREATKWHAVLTASNQEIAKLIHSDRIDILIDLSGHTAYNRLPVFALRPAPLSISWIGYPGTTGLSSIDYRLTSTDIAQPGELDDQFTEKLLYMPMPVQFEPEKSSPDIRPLPALSGGTFTFGSLNRPKKLNDRVLRLWARILVASPSSRMILGYMVDKAMCEDFRTRLENLGVKPRQLEFRLKTNLTDYLAMHHEIDLLLDTWPYTGGTTTNHGMWMGVPTITLKGKTMAARQGIEIMRAYGMEEFLVDDEEAYYRAALQWSRQTARLSEIRLSMRQRFIGRAKGNGEGSGGFVTALRTVWENYCNGQAPASVVINE